MRGKSPLLLGIIMSAVFMAGISYAQEVKGPKIVLEEEEIILMEEGKEIKKVYVSQYGEEKQKILKQIEIKTYDKLGVKSIQDIFIKKLGREYNDEIRKSIKIKPLESPKLRFLDENGNEIKTIDLVPDDKEVKKIHPRSGKQILVKESRRRYAVVSKDGKNALFIETLSENLIPSDDEKFPETDTSLMIQSQINYFNKDGALVWKKQSPKNMSIEKTNISDRGEVIAYMQIYVTGGLEKSEPYEALLVVDISGEQLLKFPKSRDGIRLAGSDLMTSPSGRYLSVNGSENKKSVTFFLDVSKKSIWVAPKIYAVTRISDNGEAEVSYPNPDVKITDPYEKKMREGIIQEVINLKKYFGEE